MEQTENKIIIGESTEGKTTSFEKAIAYPNKRIVVIEDCPEIPVKSD